MQRTNNRRTNELRKINFTQNYTCYAEGSVLVEYGNTKVLCNASVSNDLPKFLVGKNQGWVSAEYAMLPRATHTRNSREINKPNPRNQEIQRLISRSLRNTIDLQKLGERKITIDCDVIQADGGTRSASISGGYLALAIAITKLMHENIIQQNPLKNQVAAVSAGIIGQAILLDLDYSEDSGCDSDINIIMNEKLELIEVQGTAEGRPFSRSQLNKILDIAELGIKEIIQLQQSHLAKL